METRVVIDSKFDFGNVVATRHFLTTAKLINSRCCRIWCATQIATGVTSANPTGKATIKP